MRNHSFTAFSLSLALVFVCGCRRESPQVVCVRQLGILDMCARSWALEENLSVTQLIAPSSLSGSWEQIFPFAPPER
jgi:hypothetical protein